MERFLAQTQSGSRLPCRRAEPARCACGRGFQAEARASDDYAVRLAGRLTAGCAGAGRALLDTALSHLSTRGPRPVRLWVLTANTPARRFYERCRFVADGAVATYITQRPNGATVDVAEVRYARAVARKPATP